MDLHMPIMNGFETIAAIRAGINKIQCVNIPIVALTADATEETRNLVINLGANEFLTKPINDDILSRVTNEMLRTSSLNPVYSPVS
jgi:CheY-like chemotaxis protein